MRISEIWEGSAPREKINLRISSAHRGGKAAKTLSVNCFFVPFYQKSSENIKKIVILQRLFFLDFSCRLW